MCVRVCAVMHRYSWGYHIQLNIHPSSQLPLLTDFQLLEMEILFRLDTLLFHCLDLGSTRDKPYLVMSL